MNEKQWKLIVRFMFLVIYILNRYVKTSKPESRDLGWEFEADLHEELFNE